MSSNGQDVSSQVDDVRERAIGFFRLLRDFAQSRQSLIRQVEDYPDHLWLYELPYSSDCYTRANGPSEERSEELWVEVRQKPEPRCPDVPECVKPWIKTDFPFGSNPDDEPEVFERIPFVNHGSYDSTSELDGPEYDELENHTNIVRTWDEYLVEQWLPWTERHQEWQKHHAVYARLFSIHQAQLREGERFELVLGLGCLLWLTPSKQRVVRHILTIPAHLEFDPNQGLFSVGPTQDGVRVSLELDMLEADERPVENLERNLSESIHKLEEDLWDRETLDSVLRSVAKSLDDRAEYEEAIGPLPRLGQAPIVVFAPGLVYRRRSARGMVEAFTKIVEDLEKGGSIPGNIRKLAERPGSEVPVSDSSDLANLGSEENGDDDVYFPLPTNREQNGIVDKLRSNSGLLVQGPPGTGKSHTIANLVCHLLATGKRVLVTAQTPQALSVLKNKIPSSLRSLCVSVLGHDRTSISELESCVRGIADREAAWDQELELERMRETEHKLRGFREQCALVDRELESLRRRELENQIVAGGSYEGTAKTIARHLRTEEGTFGWLQDDIEYDADVPLGVDEFHELLQGLRSIDNERVREIEQTVPDLAAFGVSLDELIGLIGRERSFEEKRKSIIASGKRAHYEVLLRASSLRRELQELNDALRRLRKGISEVDNRTCEWMKRCLRDVLASNDRPWKELARVTCGKLSGLAERARRIQGKDISVSPGGEYAKLQADALDLREYLNSGGKLRLWSKFTNATVRRTHYVTSVVTVEGRSCRDIEALEALLDWIEIERTTQFIWNMWDGTAEREDGPPSLQIARLEEHLESLNAILTLEEALAAASNAVSSIPGLQQPVWHDAESRENLFRSCQATVASILARDASEALGRVASKLQVMASHDDAHRTCRELVEALQSRDEAAIRSVVGELAVLQADRLLFDKCQQHLRKVAAAAPCLAAEVEATARDAVWDDRVLVLRAAWTWAKARSWLKSFLSATNGEELPVKYERLLKQASCAMETLASTKAWSNCIGRLTETHRQNLVAWQQAIRRIGAGTGRHAERHRKSAKMHLSECQEAIPAWVMPMYRLYETIEPRPGLFDVIIVDESSQCGLDGMFLLYIGKQLVIVGDDEQISPTRITDHDSFQYLVKQFLPNYHLASVMQPDTSLFDLGEVWFRNRIVLREHFRCMPEIIRFSNNLCYSQTPLIPLRQYPPDRLSPVKAVYIPNGLEHGSGQRRTNPQEARSLVDAVVACCQDTRYSDKTMGVISLLGDAQARLIENELVEKLGPEEIEKRKILCGDAYSFQGDERDVMFLSLVVAPLNTSGERSLFRAVTTKQFKQRYNVAASRARDQMWLFHSVRLEDLRNPDDLRRRLVEHCTNPGKPADEIGDINVEELRYLAARDERPHGTQPLPFESWFEVDVFLELFGRGYRVVPQFPTLVGNYRIDLVIDGDKSRLAVECDGDYWHGPEQYYEDMERQRQLERAGWTFWRIRSSEYYGYREKALEPLWHRLNTLGIESSRDDGLSASGGASVHQEDGDVVDGSDGEGIGTFGDVLTNSSQQSTTDCVGNTDEAGEQVVQDSGPELGCWKPRQLEHPEGESLSDIADVLSEIVQAEGPMIESRLYKIYARAAGIQRLRRSTRQRLSRALDKARRDGLVERRKECGQVVVWSVGASDVLVRARGDRSLHEVPPSEVAVHIREILAGQPDATDSEIIEGLRDRLEIGRVTNVARTLLCNIRKELVAETQ